MYWNLYFTACSPVSGNRSAPEWAFRWAEITWSQNLHIYSSKCETKSKTHINHKLKTLSPTTLEDGKMPTVHDFHSIHSSNSWDGGARKKKTIIKPLNKCHGKLQPVKKSYKMSTDTECSPFSTEPRLSLQKHLLLSKLLEREPYTGCLNSCRTEASYRFLWSWLYLIFPLPLFPIYRGLK